jgi:2,5-diketo-D-gluconate reductase A
MALIIHNDIVPAVNQVETHPFHPQNETQQFLRENNVQMESWGPFAEGKNNIFHNELLQSIAGKYKKSIAQVILRWLIQRGVVAIPKSVRKERTIKTLDTNASSFFDHRDPKMVKWLGERKLDV